jgi:hypothetical protein
LPDAIVVCALPYAGRSRKLDRARLARLVREKAGAHDR